MARWTIVYDACAYNDALRLARGSYQRGLVQGYESLSGSTLKGKAKFYGASYSKSRDGLLKRLTHAGVSWHEESGEHNARLLCFGRKPTPLDDLITEADRQRQIDCDWAL